MRIVVGTVRSGKLAPPPNGKSWIRHWSMSEHYGLNGGKASDWLRLYTPNWAVSDFAGGVRLTSSDGRDQFKPYGSLFHPNWREVRRS